MAVHVDGDKNSEPVQLNMGKGYILTLRWLMVPANKFTDAELFNQESVAGNTELFDEIEEVNTQQI